MFSPNASRLKIIPRPSSCEFVHSLALVHMSQLPVSTKVITVRESPKDRKPRYHDAPLEHRAIPPLQKGQVLVKIGAAAFNHRDVGIVAHVDVSGPYANGRSTRFGSARGCIQASRLARCSVRMVQVCSSDALLIARARAM